VYNTIFQTLFIHIDTYNVSREYVRGYKLEKDAHQEPEVFKTMNLTTKITVKTFKISFYIIDIETYPHVNKTRFQQTYFPAGVD
jgi:hypothetical protein